MKPILTIFTLLIAQAAIAETTVSTPVAGPWTLNRGNMTVASASGPMSDCRAKAAVDAQSRQATASYTCSQPETMTVTYTVAPVQCATTQPAIDSQLASCPAGSFGTFTQTRSYGLQASPTCWQPGAWSPSTPPAGACSTTAPSGTYVTTFDATENPLSEGGKWRRANNAWTNMRTANGVAIGTTGITGSYDDSYAYLTQPFGNDYEIEGVAYRSPSLVSGSSNEIELHLRVSDDTNNVRLYEVVWQAYGGQQIVRWNGPFGDITVLPTTELKYFASAIKDGDRLKASIVGNVITMYVNGVATQRATDNTIPTGQPGIGVYYKVGADPAAFGWSQITVTRK